MHAKHLVMQQGPGGGGMQDNRGDMQDGALFDKCQDFMGSIWRDDMAEYDMWEKEEGWEGEKEPNTKLPQEKSQQRPGDG